MMLATDFAVTPCSAPASDDWIAEVFANPGFARHHTDHMVQVDWDVQSGWRNPRVIPYGPLMLDPMTSALHYGQEIFEGMKAYRHSDGSIVCFRPDQNAARFARSATRMAMPTLPEDLFIASIEALLAQDSRWVPTGTEASLYLRPFMFATEPVLGVKPSGSYTYLLIAAPAGAYFPGGIKPVTVWLSTEYVRAVPGGTGEAKAAGNYAASLIAQAQAAEQGCDQVVWLDALERRFVEEVGAMNLYFVFGSGSQARLVTPKLTGSLLPGVTRSSLLTVAQDLGYAVEERAISVDEWREGTQAGAITEVFGCGTAAVITPVGHVKSAMGEWSVGDGQPGPVAMQLRETLLGIQTGRIEDRHGWVRRMG